MLLYRPSRWEHNLDMEMGTHLKLGEFKCDKICSSEQMQGKTFRIFLLVVVKKNNNKRFVCIYIYIWGEQNHDYFTIKAFQGLKISLLTRLILHSQCLSLVTQAHYLEYFKDYTEEYASEVNIALNIPRWTIHRQPTSKVWMRSSHQDRMWSQGR